MGNIHIIKVTPNNVGFLQEINKRTFSETYSAMNKEEDMRKHIEESFSLDRLSAELNNKDSMFYFAVIDNNVIGYLKLNFGQSQTELKDGNGLEIERIYVLSAFHGKNVGYMLYEKAMEVAQQIEAEYIWLGVWENNPKAIRFYKKNGFLEFDKHIFRLGNDEQTDIMMKKQVEEKNNINS